MSKIAYACLVLLAFYNAASADCGRLRVQISNLSSVSCVLKNQGPPVRGFMLSLPPALILAGGSGAFEITQSSGYGPDIVLTYQCGESLVTFKSQQNYCFPTAGDITGTLKSSSGNIKISYTAASGSFIYGTPGNIYWKIEDLGK